MPEALKSMLIQHAVRIRQNDDIVGTGFLIVPKDNTNAYVLTAAHVLCTYSDNLNIQFLGVTDENSNTRLVSADMVTSHRSYRHELSKDQVQYCDVACICIAKEPWMDTISHIFWDTPEVEMPIQAVGFAAINPDPELPHACVFHQTYIRLYTSDTHRISATIQGDFILNHADLDNDIQGMSGTVFAATGQNAVIIIGMMVATTGENAALGQMNIVDTTGIQELLKEHDVVLAQRSISPIVSTDERSFAYMIDHIKPKERSSNSFHYLNPAIGFWGRDREIQALEDFLNDNREIAFLSIVAPGGCGKSKLAYEFTQRHSDDTTWKMEYLEKGQIHRLFDFPNYCYPNNLLLIVDYAGLHAKILGEWLYHLSSLPNNCKPTKTRLLLLERDQTVNVDIMTIPAAWLRDLYGSSNQAKVISEFRYVSEVYPNGGTLRPLGDNALLELMNQYAVQHDHPLPDGIAQKLLKYLKQKETDRTNSARPLIALFMTDAYIHGHPVTSWNTNDIFEHFIGRTKGHWDRLSSDNSELRTSIENCVTYATLVGLLPLDDAPSFLSEDVHCFDRLGDEQAIAIVCGINQCAFFDNTILPMEPDIVGEYFLFQKMKAMSLRKAKLQNMMQEAWMNTEGCFAVLARSIHDYGHHPDFADFYISNLDILMPLDRNNVEIEAHSRLLHLLQHQFKGVDRNIVLANSMKALHEKYPDNLVVTENYAASLMLKYYIHLWKWWEQEENVAELYNLHMNNPDSDYICTMYGKSLFNQMSSCIHALPSARNPMDRKKCIEGVDHYYNLLDTLCKNHPNNQWLSESLMKAKFLKFHPYLTKNQQK